VKTITFMKSGFGASKQSRQTMMLHSEQILELILVDLWQLRGHRSVAGVPVNWYGTNLPSWKEWLSITRFFGMIGR
jgi:hypothetical protein